MRNVMLVVGMFCLAAACGMGLGNIGVSTYNAMQPKAAPAPQVETTVETLIVAVTEDGHAVNITDSEAPQGTVYLIFITVDRGGVPVYQQVSMLLMIGGELGQLDLPLGEASAVTVRVELIDAAKAAGADQF